MEAVEERVCDQPVLKLLRAMLRAGVMEDGQVRREAAGTPQGGVVSPVMCNVYLHRLDREWDDARRGPGPLCRRPGCDVLVPQPGRAGPGAADGPAGRPGPGAEGGQDPDRAPGGGRRGF